MALGIPVTGGSTLDALLAGDGVDVACIDARRGEVFAAGAGIEPLRDRTRRRWPGFCRRGDRGRRRCGALPRALGARDPGRRRSAARALGPPPRRPVRPGGTARSAVPAGARRRSEPGRRGGPPNDDRRRVPAARAGRPGRDRGDRAARVSHAVVAVDVRRRAGEARRASAWGRSRAARCSAT